MKINIKQLVICIAIPVLVGLVAGFFTRDGVEVFADLNKPPLSPPAWLFPVVWTVLYILMGIASYLIVRKGQEGKDVEKALGAYFLQLFFNFVWPFFFFDLGWYLAAFLWLVVMWILILVTIVRFWRIDRLAAVLMIPYLLWTTFAGYLNLSIYLLN